MTSWKERTEISKNSLDVVKALFVVGIIVVLLFRSDLVNDLFDQYNVLQLEFGGLKMDRSEAIRKLKFNADQLPQVRAQVTEAQQQLGALQSRYQEAATVLSKLKKERDEAVAQLQALGRTVQSAGVNVEDVLDQQAKTIDLVKNAKFEPGKRGLNYRPSSR